jgi:polyhydroxybutyrate depolymerase
VINARSHLVTHPSSLITRLLCISLILSASTAIADTPLKPGDFNLAVATDGSTTRPTGGPTTRPYILHMPPNTGTPLPLVMVLHGAGGTAAGAADHYGWKELGDARGFIAVFPQGMPFDPSRPADFRGNPNVWDDYSGRMDAQARPDDVAYLTAVLDDVAARCAVDRNRIYLTGFSNGASMTFRMGIELPDRFAALAPVSGHCWHKDITPKRPVPMMFIVGTADPLNPINGGPGANPWGPRTNKPAYAESVAAWRQAIAAAETPTSTQSDNGVTTTTFTGQNGCPLIFITIEGQGHEWPGHPRVLPRILTGENRTTPDATALIWEFFKDQSLGR